MAAHTTRGVDTVNLKVDVINERTSELSQRCTINRLVHLERGGADDLHQDGIDAAAVSKRVPHYQTEDTC